MTHRGAHARGGLATRSHYYALWLLGNEVNAGRHGFRCSPASHIARFLLSPLLLLHSPPVTISARSYTHTQPVTPPISYWKKPFMGINLSAQVRQPLR